MRKRTKDFSPFVSNEQQIEGLTSTLKQVLPQQLLHALDVLVREGMMSKSRKHLIIKRMRYILGMAHEKYLKLKLKGK